MVVSENGGNCEIFYFYFYFILFLFLFYFIFIFILFYKFCGIGCSHFPPITLHHESKIIIFHTIASLLFIINLDLSFTHYIAYIRSNSE